MNRDEAHRRDPDIPFWSRDGLFLSENAYRNLSGRGFRAFPSWAWEFSSWDCPSLLLIKALCSGQTDRGEKTSSLRFLGQPNRLFFSWVRLRWQPFSLNELGYPLMSFLLLFALLRILGVRRWAYNLSLSLLTATGAYFLFVLWLADPSAKGMDRTLREREMFESLQHLITGFGIALTIHNLFYCLIGAIIGTLIGVLPGLGPIAGIALLIPATYNLNATSAIIMLAGIYYGAMYGGSTTSILLNVPGETASVITCIDGYQMAQKGRAGPALAICAHRLIHCRNHCHPRIGFSGSAAR